MNYVKVMGGLSVWPTPYQCDKQSSYKNYATFYEYELEIH